MKKNQKPLKSAEFSLIHLMGSDEDKQQLYRSHRCPQEFLNAAFNEWALNSTTRAQGFKTALLENPKLTTEQVEKLEQDPNHEIKWLANQHPANKEFSQKVFKHFSKMAWENLVNILTPNPHITQLIKEGCFCTGGALGELVRMVTPVVSPNNRRKNNTHEKINDFDFYFSDREKLIKVVTHFTSNVKPLLSTDPEYTPIPQDLSLSPTELGFEIPALKDGGTVIGIYSLARTFLPVKLVITNNAVTVKYPDNIDLQFIFKVFKPTPKEIVEGFDFAHCQGILNLTDQSITLTPEIYISMIQKELIFKGGINPVNSLVRMIKLTNKKKWMINRVQLIKMMAYTSTKVDFTNVKEIKEALKGFYFEKRYPEFFDYPENQKISIEELFEWMETLSY